MKKYILSAVFSLGLLISPTFTQAAALTTVQANSLITVVQSSPSTPASAFVNLITAFSGITVAQATSLVVVVQSSPSSSVSAFVNLLIAFTNDTATTQTLTTPTIATFNFSSNGTTLTWTSSNTNSCQYKVNNGNWLPIGSLNGSASLLGMGLSAGTSYTFTGHCLSSTGTYGSTSTVTYTPAVDTSVPTPAPTTSGSATITTTPVTTGQFSGPLSIALTVVSSAYNVATFEYGDGVSASCGSTSIFSTDCRTVHTYPSAGTYTIRFIVNGATWGSKTIAVGNGQVTDVSATGLRGIVGTFAFDSGMGGNCKVQVGQSSCVAHILLHFVNVPLGTIVDIKKVGTTVNSLYTATVSSGFTEIYKQITLTLPLGTTTLYPEFRDGQGHVSTATQMALEVPIVCDTGLTPNSAGVCAATAAGTPTITSFTASPTSITAGQSTTLSWTSTGADIGSSCALNYNGMSLGLKLPNSSFVVSPTVTATYDLTCAKYNPATSSNINSPTSHVTVTVGGVVAGLRGITGTFAFDSAMGGNCKVQVGQSSCGTHLTFHFSNIPSSTIVDIAQLGVNSSYYETTVASGVTEITRQIGVTLPLGTATLYPEFRDGQGLVSSATQMSLVVPIVCDTGLTPNSTGVCTSSGTTVAPTHTSLSIPSSVRQNDPFAMSWSGNNYPTYYQYNVNGGTVFQTVTAPFWMGTAASLGLSPGTTYTPGVRSCNSAGCSPLATGSLTVNLAASTVVPGLILSINGTAVGNGVSIPVPNGVVTFKWGATGNPTTCSIAGNVVSTTDHTFVMTGGLTAGSYTFTCTNSAGTSTSKFNVTNIPVPGITTITMPSSVSISETFTISWTATNSPTYYQYYSTGLFLHDTSATSWTGTAADLGLNTGMTNLFGVYSCNLAGCGLLATKSIFVTAPATSAPTITSFTASPTSITAGQSTTLSWTSNGTDTHTLSTGAVVAYNSCILDANGTVGLGTEPANSSVVVSPKVTTTYNLSCQKYSPGPYSPTSHVTVTVTNLGASAYDAFSSAMNAGSSESPSTGNTNTFHYVWNNNLQIGSSYTADVSALQTALTREGVYTGEVSGGFYNQTFSAVKAFQQKYGIDTGTSGAGFVGLKTRAKLNTLY